MAERKIFSLEVLMSRKRRRAERDSLRSDRMTALKRFISFNPEEPLPVVDDGGLTVGILEVYDLKKLGSRALYAARQDLAKHGRGREADTAIQMAKSVDQTMTRASRSFELSRIFGRSGQVFPAPGK
jgi:hypothetical protein